jgi:hypothetical protein
MVIQKEMNTRVANDENWCPLMEEMHITFKRKNSLEN